MAVKWADDCWLLKYLVEKHTGEQLFEWVWCTRSDRHAIVSRRSQASPTIRDSRLVASMPWRLFFPGRSADRTNIFSGMLSPLVFVLLAELVRSSPYLSLSQAPLDQRKSLFFIVYFFFFFCILMLFLQRCITMASACTYSFTYVLSAYLFQYVIHDG